jgi:hypothetical protein
MNDYHIRWSPDLRCYELLKWSEDQGKYQLGYSVKRWTKEEFNKLCTLLLSLKEE